MSGAKNAFSWEAEPDIRIYKAVDETRTPQPTPEQLIKLLDFQLIMARAKRAPEKSPNRAAMLIGGLLFIVAGCGAALLLLQHLLSDLQHPPLATSPENAPATAQNANF